jgi:hypothetical protein
MLSLNPMVIDRPALCSGHSGRNAARQSRRDPMETAMAGLPTGTVTFLFTGVEGSTAL